MSDYQLIDEVPNRGITVNPRRYSLGQKVTATIVAGALAIALSFSACRNQPADYDGAGYSNLPTMNMPMDAGMSQDILDARVSSADIDLPAGVPEAEPIDIPPELEDILSDDINPNSPQTSTPPAAAPAPDATVSTDNTHQDSRLGPLYGEFAFDSPRVNPEFEQAIRKYVRSAIHDEAEALYVVGLASMESAQDGKHPRLDDDAWNIYRSRTRADSIADIALDEMERIGASIPIFKRYEDAENIGRSGGNLARISEDRIGMIAVEVMGDIDREERQANLIRGHQPNEIYHVNESYAAEHLGEEPATAAAPAHASRGPWHRAAEQVRPSAHPHANSAPAAHVSHPSPAAPAPHVTPATSIGTYSHQPAPALAPTVAPEVPEYVASPVQPAHEQAEAAAPAVADEPVAVEQPPAPTPAAEPAAAPAPAHQPIIAPNGAVVEFGTFGTPMADQEPQVVLPADDEPEQPAEQVTPIEVTPSPAPAASPDAPISKATYVPAALPADNYVPQDAIARIETLEKFVETRGQRLEHFYSILSTVESECGPSGSGNTLCAIAEQEGYANSCGDDNNPNTPAYEGAHTVCYEAVLDSNSMIKGLEHDIEHAETVLSQIRGHEEEHSTSMLVPAALPLDAYVPADVAARIAALEQYAADRDASVQSHYS